MNIDTTLEDTLSKGLDSRHPGGIVDLEPGNHLEYTFLKGLEVDSMVEIDVESSTWRLTDKGAELMKILAFDHNLQASNHNQTWPFVEARKLLKKLNYTIPKKGYVLFSTGFSPSGKPHIGTVGEVVRTQMVRKAFEIISGMETKLYVFIDDMDGMRKPPEGHEEDREVPLCRIESKEEHFDTYSGYYGYLMIELLDHLNLDYEIKSASEFYLEDSFVEILHKVADNLDEISDIVKPTLGEERQKTYSPIIPIDFKTGAYRYVPVINNDGCLHFPQEPYNGGVCLLDIAEEDEICYKLQWKVDLPARWAAFDVDFEMYGKDHATNTHIYDSICKLLGKEPPAHYNYELFLDEDGKKISKTKNNGVTLEEWLRYGSMESLLYYMYIRPTSAKKLTYSVIPKAMDDYDAHVKNYVYLGGGRETAKNLENPVFHVLGGNNPGPGFVGFSFATLLNLVSTLKTKDKEVLRSYVGLSSTNLAEDRFLDYAINYFTDFVEPSLDYKTPNKFEILQLKELMHKLSSVPESYSPKEIQDVVYQVGRAMNYENIKDWFVLLYQVLFGADQGPRIGSFIKVYGVANTIELIKEKINNE